MIFIKAMRDAILKPLQAVAGIVERRHTMPILANILIRTQAEDASFLASDHQIQIETHAPIACGSEPVALTVNARKLIDLLRSLPETMISLSYKQNRLSISAGKSRYTLQTLNAQEFPFIEPDKTVSVRLSLPEAGLAHLFNMVHFAMAQNDVRYHLTGLLLVATDQSVRAVATDGHRLAYQTCPYDDLSPDANHEVIIPRKTVTELQRLLNDPEAHIKVELSPRQIRFQFGCIDLISKVVEGRFPDYQSVIPKHYARIVELNRDLLLSALSRSAILTTEKFKGVRVVLSPGVLKISTTNIEQEEAVEELDVDYDGDELDMGFNVGYLLDVLANLKSETIRLEFGDASSSLLICVPKVDGFKYVVMPMRI
jgi:DNA polymerase-3 subunit beta